MTKKELKTAKRLLAERIFLNTVYAKKISHEMIEKRVCKAFAARSIKMAEQFYDACSEDEKQELIETKNGSASLFSERVRKMVGKLSKGGRND